MSYESDQRVVVLSFDNKKFEANVSQTLDSLDKLKESLKFEGAVEGFKDLDKAARDVDLSRIADGVDYLTDRFTILGKVTERIKDTIAGGILSVVGLGSSEVRSMTAMGQLSNAWNQYNEQVTSVQTIMAATRTQFKEDVNQMAEVQKQLEKLTWFTDETSYSYMDMVNNIGKFTSQNIRLDKAIDEMQGIANWAALSGGGIEAASAAMDTLSKTLGAGYVNLQRWSQLGGRNMTTAEFKQVVL